MDYNSEVSYAFQIKLIIFGIGILFFIAAIYFYHRSFFKTQSDINANFGTWSILIKKATPGTLFLIAALIIVITGASKKMGSESTSKSNVDKKELQTNIESLRIDTSLELRSNQFPNIDSMISSGNDQAKKRRFLNALKTMYLVKGIIYLDSSKKIQLLQVNQSIGLFESILNEQLNRLPQQTNTEETRSTNINNTSNDSIR